MGLTQIQICPRALASTCQQMLPVQRPAAEGGNKLRGRGEREEGDRRGRERGERRGREERGEGERRGRRGKVIHLSKTDKAGEDECPKSHSENTVNEVATEHRQNHIWPRVQRIEESILSHRHTHHLWKQQFRKSEKSGLSST